MHDYTLCNTGFLYGMQYWVARQNILTVLFSTTVLIVHACEHGGLYFCNRQNIFAVQGLCRGSSDPMLRSAGRRICKWSSYVALRGIIEEREPLFAYLQM